MKVSINIAICASSALLFEATTAFSFGSIPIFGQSLELTNGGLDKSKMARRSRPRPRDVRLNRRQDTDSPSNTNSQILSSDTPTPTDTSIPTESGAVETAPLPSGTGQFQEPLPSDTSFVQIYSDIDDTIYVQAGIDGNLYLTILDVSSNSNETTQVTSTAIDSQEATATSSGAVPTNTSTNDDSDGGLDTSTFFQSDLTGMVTGDYNGRFLHMYQGEMDTYNVSRIRLHDEDSLPVSSVLVSLYPFINPNSPAGTSLIATTTEGVMYFLAACSYEEVLTKLFLVADDTGLNVLEDPAMKNVLTGGTVDTCLLLGLTNGGAGLLPLP